MIARHALAGETLEASLRRMCQAHSLLQDDVAISLVRDGSLAGIVITPLPHQPQPNFLHEFFSARAVARYVLVDGRLAQSTAL